MNSRAQEVAMTEFDPKAFRFALGNFATGVTVVTTRGLDDEDIGVTASSFNSVSLDPPLVLWSLDKKSFSMQAFQRSGHFIINVLSAGQVDISNRFARAGEDKFAGLEVKRGIDGIAMLPGCTAHFQCAIEYEYEGGDHVILVGRVKDFEVSSRPGLIFQQGRYAVGSDHPLMSKGRDDSADSGFVKNFLPYMTGRCHQVLLSGFQQTIQDGPLSDQQYRILFILKDLQRVDLTTISELSLLADDLVELWIAEMVQQGLVTQEQDQVMPTAKGLEVLSQVESKVTDYEAQMMSVFSEKEGQDFKRQLGRLLEWTLMIL